MIFKWVDVVVLYGKRCCFVIFGRQVCFGSIYPCLENVTLWRVVVGVMGCMSMCVFSVLVRMFCNS